MAAPPPPLGGGGGWVYDRGGIKNRACKYQYYHKYVTQLLYFTIYTHRFDWNTHQACKGPFHQFLAQNSLKSRKFDQKPIKFHQNPRKIHTNRCKNHKIHAWWAIY